MDHPEKLNVEISGIDTQPSTSKATDDPKPSPAQSKPTTSEVTNGVNDSVDPKPSTSAATDVIKLTAVIPKTSPAGDEITESQPAGGLPNKPLEIDENEELRDAIKCYEGIMNHCRFLQKILLHISQLASDELRDIAEESADWEILKYGPDAANEKASNILSKMEELDGRLYLMDLENLSRYLEDVIPLSQDIILICTNLENKICVYKDNINTYSIFTPERSKIKTLLEELLDELRYCLHNLRCYIGKLQGEDVGLPRIGFITETKPSRLIPIIKHVGSIFLLTIPAIGIALFTYFYYYYKYTPAAHVGSPSFNEQNSTISQPNTTDVYNTSVEHDARESYKSTLGDICSTILDIIGPTDAYISIVEDYLPTRETSMNELNSTDR